MKYSTYLVIVLSAAIFFLFTGFDTGSYAAEKTGWCCRNGKVFSSTRSACQQKKGRFFTDRKQAMACADAETKGYCCARGRVLAMKKQDCQKRKGFFSTDKARASKYCEDRQAGWCCRNGRIFLTKKTDCLKKKGAFFVDKRVAAKKCAPSGWCLWKGKVHRSTKADCLKKKGRFFATRAEAMRAEKFRKAGLKPAASAASPSSIQLMVERVYVKDGTVRLRIRSKGRGRLSLEEYRNGRLVLKLDNTSRSWSLDKIDPRGQLNRGRYVEFNTGMHLSARSRAQVTFARLPGTKKTALLTPSAGKTMKQKKLLGQTLLPASSSLATMRGKRKKTAGSTPAMVPRTLDQGFLITFPREGDVIHRGQSLRVQYRYTRPGTAEGHIIFRLKRMPEGTAHAVFIKMIDSPGMTMEDGLQEVSFTVPGGDGVPYADNYIIEAEHSESDAYGLSDMFAIQPNAIGEGGASGTGPPHVELLSPKGGEHWPESGTTLRIRWRYHGPLEDAPSTWRIEGAHPGDSTPAFTLNSSCRNPIDESAGDMFSYPVRTCEYLYPIDDGTYNLTISGGSFTDQTDRPFHIGTDRRWPHIQIFSPTPGAGGAGDWLFQGDPIPVDWSVKPADAVVIIKITKNGEQLLMDLESGGRDFSGCDPVGDSSTTRHCRKTYTMPEDFEPGSGYKIVILGATANIQAQAQSGPFRILEPPLTSSPQPGAVDFSLHSPLRAGEDGHLMVPVQVTPANNDEAGTDNYNLKFQVGHNFSGTATSWGIAVERSVPSSAGEHIIDLGHVNGFLTAAERAAHVDETHATFTVRVNLPPTVVERDYENNLQTGGVRIKPVYLSLGRSSSDPIFFHGLSPATSNLSRFTITIDNSGYAPASGTIVVRQYAGEVPGGLSGGSVERIPLGSREITVAPTFDVQSFNLFSNGVTLPQWRNGELEVIFYGELGQLEPIRIPFQYQEPEED